MDDQKKWILGGAVVLILGLSLWGWFSARESGTADGESGASEVTERDYIKGEPEARATLIEYMDFQCPACAAYAPVVKSLTEAYPDDLRVVVRHYPLVRIHPNAIPAARTAEAAARQGKFFEMHDLLFSKQAEWSKMPDPRETFASYANELGLDAEKFRTDMESDSIDENINRGLRLGDDQGVTGTPSFFLNGKKIENPGSLEAFKAVIDEALRSETAEATSDEPAGEAVHEHADFKVYLHGQAWDFSQGKYQSTEENPLHEYIHLHDGNGQVIHKHWSGITLGDFFQSLKMELTKGCFRTDTGEAYCSGPTNTLKVWVNGAPSEKYDTLEFQDGDRILISYGNESAEKLQEQMDSVTRDSCIYSEKCPERGTPPTEACVGGLGTNCEE